MVVPQAYTNLSIFKRIEVWILLVLTMAGLVFVLLSRDTADPFDESPKPKPAAPSTSKLESTSPITYQTTQLRREGENYIAELSLSFDNQTDAPIRSIDDAKLITGSGRSIPIFFLAFTGTPPVFPANTKSDATLRFSLLGEDIVGNLTLDIAGERQEIKSTRSFDPEAIAKNESVTFKQLDW